MSKDEFNIIFDKVYSLVSNGYTIVKALQKCNISSKQFYKYASDEQKNKIRYVKTEHSICGCRTNIYEIDTHKEFINSSYDN